MSQILANAGAVTLTKTWYVNGTATDVDDVTIGIVDGNGTAVVAAGTATTNAGSGVYTYSLADQAAPNQLTVTWTDTSSGDTRVDRVEVVGNWLFTETQARSFAAKADAQSALKPLASATEYPDAVIAAERARLTDDFERWVGRGLIPRYARIELMGNGGHTIDLADGICRTSDGYHLERPGRLADIAVILAVDVSGSAATVGNIKVSGRKLIRTDGSWLRGTTADPFNITVEYVYGLPYLLDGVDRVAMLELVDRLVPSAWPDRVISADTEYGTTRFVQPGGPMDNVSRLPRVNDWVKRHDHRLFI